MAAAHAQGLVHRDIKPANLLLENGVQRVKITDFGMARAVSDANLTQSGVVTGTPQYMAPEQARGEADLIGEATDVHALGAVLYEALTGKPPYGTGSPAAVFARLLNDDPALPRTLARHVPRDLETICMKALAKNPAGRYPTARAMWEDLRRFEAGEPLENVIDVAEGY